MRLEADSEQFKRLRLAGMSVTVLLDGVEQDHVVIADEDQGTVERCVLDAAGMAQVDPAHLNRVWTETVRGKVRILIGK